MAERACGAAFVFPPEEELELLGCGGGSNCAAGGGEGRRSRNNVLHREAGQRWRGRGGGLGVCGGRGRGRVVGEEGQEASCRQKRMEAGAAEEDDREEGRQLLLVPGTLPLQLLLPSSLRFTPAARGR